MSNGRNPWLARPVASFLLENKPVLRQANQEYLAVGGGRAGARAAYEYLAEQLKDGVPGLAAKDYRDAVVDLHKAGHDGDAVLLERVAALQDVLETAHRMWNRRYEGVSQTWALTAADTMARAGLLEYLSPAPALGSEGAAYLPAIAKAGTGAEPVLIVAARGGGELVRGWTSEKQMLEWAGKRIDDGTGPLAAPPEPVMTCGWLEDLVLAGLLQYQTELAVARQLLPPGACTTDVRYELYAAMLGLSRRNGIYTPDEVAEQVRQQIRMVPEEGLTYYGGEGAPLAHRYLAKLEQTRVSYGQFVDAAKALHLANHRVRGNGAAHNSACGPEPPFLAAGPRTLLERPPGPELGGPTGPVQGR